MNFDPDKLIDIVRGLPAAHCYWVGFSGGLDSSVLLQALAQKPGELGVKLRAIHVNHHIHPQADDWQRQCEHICRDLHVPIECRSVAVKPAKGESFEAVARDQRYKVFRNLLSENDMLLLAHHQDDQMETFLLQALRGAGPRGLAAMPVTMPCGRGQLARPLLGFLRAELQAWAKTQKFAWLEDPSNADSRFDRNFLRRQVIPVIRQRWPAAAETVARSARHCAESLELLATVAETDWQQCAEGSLLSVAALQGLGELRVKNLLRYWLEKLDLTSPPSHKLEQIFREALTARTDRNPCVSWEGAEVRRYRGRLYGLAPLPETPSQESQLKPYEQASPGIGSLRLSRVTGAGIRASACPVEGLRVRYRSGGEVCQPAGHSHRRPLKQCLQEFGVVPWMRQRLPLFYVDDELVAVADLFVCAPFAALPGEAGLRIEWTSHPALH